MKIYFDGANTEKIKEAYSWGVIDGVTTNPTLISKENRPFRELVEEICSIVDGPVSVEAVSLDAEGMIKEARELSKIHKNIVVKIPIIKEGLKAVKVLSEEGIKTNVTLVFSAGQAILAAKAGASYVSPFIWRLERVGQVGFKLAEEIARILRNYNDCKTEMIVASVLDPRYIAEAALVGADIITLPFEILEEVVKHPMTDIGIKQFLADWKKVLRG
ncbi:fructose-6-phosphate aldolase [Candidatus Aerophobetes bacterium Ae_b3a]|nr:fructose-6-phosphate aldolase [Candidatus Aerophobetes bacterium]TKJ47719.1 MAG: fructose-6-phosphate aldolase [Candidatus Aerophobetes bacterium Ae_b3a]